MDEEIFEKITMKKEFSQIPRRDIERAWDLFEGKNLVDEERIKKVRDLLRRIYSGFGGKKLLLWKGWSYEEVLKKHLSTKERLDYYIEIYGRLLKNFDKKKEINVIDLGAGVNGFSYPFFEKLGYKVCYNCVEAVGQFVELTNKFFEEEKIKGKAFHDSLFNLGEIIKLAKKIKKPKIIFLFKVIDALESFERNYTKKLLLELKKCGAEKIVVSFATESWIRRKKFFAQRTWLIDFIRENFEFIDDFGVGGERYLVFRS